MTEETIIEKRDGVKVRIKAKRGSGTNDRDEIVGEAHYDTVTEAKQNSSELTTVVQDRMRELRGMDENGEVDNSDIDNDSDELGDFGES